MVVQAVADVEQIQGIGQVGLQHGDDMAVGTEGTCLDFELAGKILDYFIGYPACNLGENGRSMFLRVHGISCGCLVASIKMS